MEYPLTEQRKASLSIHLTLNELELRYMSFNHAVIDPPGETSSLQIEDKCRQKAKLIFQCTVAKLTFRHPLKLIDLRIPVPVHAEPHAM
jgi:hypothetical protein